MKLIMFLVACFSSPVALADTNFNHLGCVYYFDQSTWQPWQAFSGPNYSLALGQTKFLTGMWTSDKPDSSNYAACTTMTGTGSSDEALITSYIYKANAFDAMTGNDQCSVSGNSVELVSKTEQIVKRGTFAALETEWLPPHASKIQIREYLPTVTELENLAEVAYQKCEELTPTN